MVLRVHLQQDGVLRLPARATMVKNDLLGDEARQVVPLVLFDHCENQIPALAPADVQIGPSTMKMRSSSTFTFG